MVNYARIQAKIDKGLGIAGRHLGPPYTAYRLGANSTGDFPTAWTKLATGVPIYRERVSISELEIPLSGNETLWYSIFGGMSGYLLGDVFVMTDPAYVPGVSYGAGATSTPGTIEFNGIALAWHPAGFVPIGARLDRIGQIYRPNTTPLANVDGSSYFEDTLDNDQPLVLVNGQYSFGTPSQVANWVPLGLASMERPITSPLVKPAIPGGLYMMRYYAYLPELPGYTPTEGDAIVTQDGARHLVVHPYTQNTGVVGSQLLLDRQVSQDA